MIPFHFQTFPPGLGHLLSGPELRVQGALGVELPIPPWHTRPRALIVQGKRAGLDLDLGEPCGSS